MSEPDQDKNKPYFFLKKKNTVFVLFQGCCYLIKGIVCKRQELCLYLMLSEALK